MLGYIEPRLFRNLGYFEAIVKSPSIKTLSDISKLHKYVTLIAATTFVQLAVTAHIFPVS